MKKRKVRAIRNIPWLMTMESTKGSEVGLISNAAVLIRDEKIAWVGDEKKCPKPQGEGEDLDAAGLVAMPGLIDCHTHLIFGGDRIDDFYERSNGATYAQILSRGGGIAHTVLQTRLASEEELIGKSIQTLRRMLTRGVTTVEVKSGYGLNLDDELKVLRVVQKLNAMQPVTLVPTFLGAHAVPPEYKGDADAYIEYLIAEVLPKVVKENLAVFADVFIETGAFTKSQGTKILEAAAKAGLKLRVHADQLSHSGGSEIAARYQCVSASHLEHASNEDMRALAKAHVVAEILPLAELFLGVNRPVNVRELIDAGIKVAIATDYNPGSAMCDDLQLAMRVAITQRKMSVEEALSGVTRHASNALLLQESVGQIKVGMKADICLFEGRSPWSIAYDWSINPVREVIKNGERVR